ncbi:MAG: universal stress protein [Chloroflexi bacterium HGW-Chloroflexi-6]|nr:MAG: universal stress protein [Chloroflexi bacterium HGW-Chloroflexi-6]
MFKNILLAVDGSEHAIRAAHIAAELARCHKASLRLVAAYDPVPPYLGEPNFQIILDAQLQEADKNIAKTLGMLGDIPGEVTHEVLQGPPAEAILDAAKLQACDLIVMGSRGLGQLTGLLLGSQSQKVVQHADCPVLIVK